MQRIYLEPLFYDPAYRKINYPNGDVPAHYGVCSDVIILVVTEELALIFHKNCYMKISKANFALYPSKRIWGLSHDLILILITVEYPIWKFFLA